MVGKKIVALGIVAMALAVAGCQEKKELTQIGINQFVVHEALDASRQGFLDVLKENGYVEGEDIEIDYKNAQGEQPTALAIAVTQLHGFKLPRRSAAGSGTSAQGPVG